VFLVNEAWSSSIVSIVRNLEDRSFDVGAFVATQKSLLVHTHNSHLLKWRLPALPVTLRLHGSFLDL